MSFKFWKELDFVQSNKSIFLSSQINRSDILFRTDGAYCFFKVSLQSLNPGHWIHTQPYFPGYYSSTFSNDFPWSVWSHSLMENWSQFQEIFHDHSYRCNSFFLFVNFACLLKCFCSVIFWNQTALFITAIFRCLYLKTLETKPKTALFDYFRNQFCIH